MPIYAYMGLTAHGRTVSGVIDADSPKNARLSLRRDGIFPTAIDEESGSRTVTPASADGGGIAPLFERVSVQELALLTRQFATLVKAGLPLVESLSTLI